MKLSFSTNYWMGHDIFDFINLASKYHFQGIEIHDISILESFDIKSVKKELQNNNINISCIDMVNDFSLDEKVALKEFKNIVEISYELKNNNIRIKTNKKEVNYSFINSALDIVNQTKDLNILFETYGQFSNTKKVRELLEGFSEDSLNVLWDFYNTYRIAEEKPEVSITELGAFVKHIHLKDSVGINQFSIMGEGTTPIDDLIQSLKSINYDEFISLEWNPLWNDDIQDINIILPQFEYYMSKYKNLARNDETYYKNKTGDGDFLWKKDALINKTFSEVLDDYVKEFPNKIAFKFTTLDYTRTYEEFKEDVEDAARSLIAVGVKKGTHVAMWATNIPQWFIIFWATAKIGAVFVSMNTAYKIHEAEYLLRQSDTHTLFMIDGYKDSNYIETIKELCPELKDFDENKLNNNKEIKHLHIKRLPFLRNIISIGFREKGVITWNKFVKQKKLVPISELKRHESLVSPHDVCNMQYTSGTTGFPKGVMLTHHNIINNGKCIGDRMDLSSKDRMMIQVPMFHCFGMVLSMTAAMTHAVSLYPLPYFSPKSAIATIKNEKITCFNGVPTMFIALLEHKDFNKEYFKHIRTGIMAGSPCPESIMKKVQNDMHMTEITIVYGQTEASPGCTMSDADDDLQVRISTVGHELPEIECKIINPETQEEAKINEPGEFVARGYNIMKGYYKMPVETKKAIDEQGFLHTGDIAVKCSDGNYKITGRLKDMIIRGGENIYPKEIEEFIYTHTKVKDVQVVGVPDETLGEEIWASIILKENEELTENEIKQYMTSNLAKHKVPRYIEFVKEFPMNVAGKVLKYKLREEAIKKIKEEI